MDLPGSCHHERPCLLLHLLGAPYACCFRCSLERLCHMLELAEANRTRTPKRDSQTSPSGAQTRRTRAAPGGRVPTR